MGRSNPKIRIITIFDSQNPKHQLVFSLLWYSLVVVLFGLAIYRVMMHHPADFYKLFAYTACFGVILFVSILGSAGLWSKPLFRRSPLWLILTIFLWGILLYPVVTHSPIDFFVLFSYLASFAFVFMLQIKTLARERNTPI
jgi:hypothetical protein